MLRSAPSPTQWPSLVENKDKMAGESSGHIIYGGLSKVVVTPNDHFITSNDMINCTFDLGVNAQQRTMVLWGTTILENPHMVNINK